MFTLDLLLVICKAHVAKQLVSARCYSAFFLDLIFFTSLQVGENKNESK